jgi:multiple sugar transport system substrate-binding protein
MDRRRALALLGATAAALGGCGRGGARPEDDGRLVFAHQPLWGDAAPFDALLDGFRASHPGLALVTQTVPNASDLLHQLLLTSLEGGSTDVDLMILDVVWVAEFARAGWIADLSDALPPSTVRRDLLPGAADAVIVEGRTWAVPWYLDVGLLYRRADLAPEPPRTFDDLRRMAADVRRVTPSVDGFVWQGRQYEGLLCNVYEAIWGHGGVAMQGGRLSLDAEPSRAGVAWLRGAIEDGTSPRDVTSMAEEDARRAFQDERAVFMRNWPYAWAEAQREGSRVRGRVAISALPSVDGAGGFGTLGGWMLAVNAHAPPHRRDLAVALAQHLTSVDAAITMAAAYGRNPARRAAYDDLRLAAQAPAIAAMRAVLERARPRPVTPYWPMLSDALQGELSAAVSGLRSPREALASAQTAADRLMGERR